MTYCPLPFRHVFIEPKGVKPCCSYTRSMDMTVEQWLASDELKILQSNMLNGISDPGCQDCTNAEKTFGTSTRLGALKDYPDRVEDTQINYVDYRSSNICNFKCRTCEPFFSNGIAMEAKKSEFLIALREIPKEKTANTSDPDWIIEHLPQIRRLMFTGGEPTMLPEVRRIIEQIRDRDLDISVLLITNGSFRDPWWLEQARIMPNLNFTVSIDAVGPAAEMIRHGTDWFRVEYNIRQLAEHGHSLNFSTVISRMNLFQLGPLVDFVREIQTMYDRPNGRTQFVEICKHPDYLSPTVWPVGLKHFAVAYLERVAKKCHDSNIAEILETLSKTIITQDYDHALWERGELYNMELDRLRGENHARLYQPAF